MYCKIKLHDENENKEIKVELKYSASFIQILGEQKQRLKNNAEDAR